MAGDDIDDARSEFASLFSAQTGASGEGEGETIQSGLDQILNTF